MSKMSIRRIIAIVCIIISVMLIACACGNNEETTGTTNNSTTAPVVENEYLAGDLDGSGVVNATDADWLFQIIAGTRDGVTLEPIA